MIASKTLPGPTAFVVDPHPIMRFAFGRLLRGRLGYSDVVEFARFDAMRQTAAQPSLLIVAAGVPGALEKSALSRLRAAGGKARIVLTSDAGEPLWQELEREVDLVLDTRLSEDKIVEALRDMTMAGVTGRRGQGESGGRRSAPIRKLCAREAQILKLLGDGLRNRQIASALGISEPTVKHYVSGVLSAFQVSNRTKAALYANAQPQGFS